LVLLDGSNLLAKLFVDDSLLFLNANNDVIKNALITVDEFAFASGYKRNVEKSKLLLLLALNAM